jgi:toxin ParE1/3/4
VTARPVVLRERALRDVEAALDHYRTEGGPRVAEGFVDALEGAGGHLARHPGSGSPRYAHDLDLPGLRSWGLRDYPYLIFYVEMSDHLDVWRVLHEERDIPAWHRDVGPR